MGAIKDAIRKVLTEEAQRTGRDIRFIDTPAQVIETAKQAKQHDMELVEKPKKRKSLCASCRHGSRYGSSYFCAYRCSTQRNNKYKCDLYEKSQK